MVIPEAELLAVPEVTEIVERGTVGVEERALTVDISS